MYGVGGHYTALTLIRQVGCTYVQYYDDETCTTNVFSETWDDWICKTVHLFFGGPVKIIFI